ncbi:SDR family oxidoreductase [Hymenobacter taeanensis]|uniref:SDR family oxidoreductase n=1 Tax=Hymenobacter taeanensis TaxID=2735321 RepID=A0A6M6BEL0_9BACT|nr:MULTISPECIES: SDR family oxidoreductase [Hymenobacter]QJX46174.1 SDR family oxidoreductase [Hymenobacter taeanensis]UOQ80030.1 SDR family oxidoreductase [Hymenobacter sp. 5414T-23]
MAPLAQQLILVTGATSGIGKVTAQTLAKQGAHVILLARSAEKAERTQHEIRAAAGHDRVDILLCDLSDLTQVRKAAAEFNQRYPRLDVLVNNAGLLFGKERQLSAQGYEMTLATNYLGPFLLTALLLDKLRQSPAARIINVASMAYRFAKPDLTNLNQERGYGAMRQYGNTKLYNILFTQELSRRLRTKGISNVVTNSLHPGVVASNFGDNAKGWLAKLTKLFRPFMISPEQGAQTTLYLVTDEAAGHISGGFFAKQKAVAVKHPFTTPTDAQQLWEQTEALVEQNFLD